MDLATIAIYTAVVVAVIVIGVPLLKLVLGVIVTLFVALGMGIATLFTAIKKKVGGRK